MRSGIADKNRSWMNQPGRNYSPNSFGNRGNYTSASNVSVHSDHLWNMLEDVQLFPDEIHQLFRYEQRNLSSYKKSIEREKIKVTQQIDHLKKEMIHNIDDLKISILAELDRIYKNYMEKYATLKSQIVQIKKMKEEIEMDIDRRTNSFIPKYVEKKDSPDYNARQISATSNANIMRSLEKNNFEVKKYQMLNYIAELQREKIIPLNEVTKELIVLTQYENGYFQTSEFQHIAEQLIGELKGNIRSIYERKYEFIRQPEQICVREEEPILNGIYEEQQQQPFVNNPYSFQDRKIQSAIVSKLDDFKVLGVSPEEQNICLDWVENLTLEQIGTVKSQSEGIILCSLEVSKNIIAIGSKDGQINIYETSSGKKIANLRGHKASICKLALIVNNGKKYLASGSDHGCSSIVLWDITTWNMRMRIESHKAAVTAIVDLQDNRSMVSGSYDKTINVYNLNSEGKILYNLPVNKTSVTGILLNCTGSKMISCGLDDTLNVWQIVRGPNRLVETMFLERIIQNNTTICSLIASTIKPDIVLLGAKDGKIKLINTDRGEAYKTINSCNNAVIEMAVIERKSKPDYPIVICWPCKEECLKIINTQSGKVDNFQTKGFIEFGCGIGPKGYFLNSGKNLAMLSQSESKAQVSIFKMDIN